MTIFLFYVDYHYYFRFFLPNSCHGKIFKTGIRIICIIRDSTISIYAIKNIGLNGIREPR